MASPTASQRLAPDFRVRTDGVDLPPAARADLVAAEVVEDVDTPGMFVLRLINWDMVKLQVTWSDDDLFAVGKQVEVLMGYVDNLVSLIVGEVTGLEPEFGPESVPMLTVRGYDRRHRLLRSRKTRSFTQLKDSEIAGRIADDAGLTADMTDTDVTFEYVLQHEQTDLDFLLERARRIGYEIVVDDKTMHFRPRPTTGGPSLTLDLNADLLEFSPRLTSVGQVSDVSVRGWSAKDKSAFTGKASTGSEASTMGGTVSGPSASSGAFGASAFADGRLPLSGQADADAVALARLNELALGYISAEGTCNGRTDLRAGTVVKVKGAGRRFSGLYYVNATRHAYRPGRGYRTEFSARRNAT